MTHRDRVAALRVGALRGAMPPQGATGHRASTATHPEGGYAPPEAAIYRGEMGLYHRDLVLPQ